MRRLFWLAMGITIGALVVRKLSRAAERMTPAGVGASVAEALRDLADAIGDFGADVRAAMAEREAEIRAGTGLDAPLPEAGQAQLPEAGQARLPGAGQARLPGRHATDR